MAKQCVVNRNSEGEITSVAVPNFVQQNNSQLIKKQKNISIEQNEFQSICLSIKQII